MAIFTTDDWLANFRMSQSTFIYLCSALHDEIYENDTRMRLLWSGIDSMVFSHKRRLYYRTIGHLFGILEATVSVIRREVCATIVKNSSLKYICLSAGAKLVSVID